MRSFARPFATVAVCGLAMLCTACGSSNKGKIEGKWKLVSAPGADENKTKEVEKAGGYVFFDFAADGSVKVGLAAADPSKGKSDGLVLSSGKYRLLKGDKIEFVGMTGEKGGGGLFGKSDRSVLAVAIRGDDMTMTAQDGTAKLVRLK